MARFHDMHQNRMHAALGVTVGKITLLHGQKLNVVLRKRAGLAQLADQKIGERLLGLAPSGESYIFCKNNANLTAADIAGAGKSVPAGDYRGREFAGACFDPNGDVMFVNMQSPGITYAIWGPWARGNL